MPVRPETLPPMEYVAAGGGCDVEDAAGEDPLQPDKQSVAATISVNSQNFIDLSRCEGGAETLESASVSNAEADTMARMGYFEGNGVKIYSALRKRNLRVTVRPSWLAWTMMEESGKADSSTSTEISVLPVESVTAWV